MKQNQEKKKKSNSVLIGIVVTICTIACVATAIAVSIYVMNDIKRERLEEQLEEAEECYEKMDYEDAIEAYEDAIKIDPESKDAYIGLAEVYVVMKEYEDAIEILEEGYDETESSAIRRKLQEIEELQEQYEARLAIQHDYELADRIHSAVITSMMDPEVVTDEESNTYLSSINCVRVDMCSIDEVNNKFIEGVIDILGRPARGTDSEDIISLSKLSDLGDMVKSSSFTGHIWMFIDRNTVSIEFEGTDIIIN